MCLLCVAGLDAAGEQARRLRMLRLLALVEHPDALPTDAALRLGGEIMAMLGPARASLRCDPIVPSAAKGEQP